MACGTLVPCPGIEPVPPAVEAWSLNHWTTREVPYTLILIACGSRILQRLKMKWREGETTPWIISHKLAVVALYRSDLKAQTKLDLTCWGQLCQKSWGRSGAQKTTRCFTRKSQTHKLGLAGRLSDPSLMKGIQTEVCAGRLYLLSQTAVARGFPVLYRGHGQWGLCHG